MEIWKDIIGYEGLYQVSNLGNIKHYLKGILNKHVKKNGYEYIELHKNNIYKKYYIHRLVCLSFLKNTFNKEQVNHIDGNKLNNNLNNLEWCTRSENQKHKYNILGFKSGNLGNFNNSGSKKVNQYDLQGNFIKTWDSTMDIFRVLNIKSCRISMCCTGKRKKTCGFIWKYI